MIQSRLTPYAGDGGDGTEFDLDSDVAKTLGFGLERLADSTPFIGAERSVTEFVCTDLETADS